MYKVIEVKQSIFEDNNKDADLLRQECKEKGVFLLNIMSSPGSGKTTTLSRTIETMKDEVNIGVMEQILIVMWMRTLLASMVYV